MATAILDTFILGFAKVKKIQPCIPSCQASVVPGLWMAFFDKHTNGEHVLRGTKQTNKGSSIPIGSIYGIFVCIYIYRHFYPQKQPRVGKYTRQPWKRHGQQHQPNTPRNHRVNYEGLSNHCSPNALFLNTFVSGRGVKQQPTWIKAIQVTLNKHTTFKTS